MSPLLELDYIGLAQFLPADKLSSGVGENLRETELRLGLPGSESPEKLGLTLHLQLLKGHASGAKRGFSDAIDGSKNWGFSVSGGSDTEMEISGAVFSPGGVGGGQATVAGNVTTTQEKKPQGPPNAKAQVVGWPPIRSYRKNTMAINPLNNKEDVERKQGLGCLYIKVSMDGAPDLRKVDLRGHRFLRNTRISCFSAIALSEKAVFNGELKVRRGVELNGELKRIALTDVENGKMVGGCGLVHVTQVNNSLVVDEILPLHCWKWAPGIAE